MQKRGPKPRLREVQARNAGYVNGEMPRARQRQGATEQLRWIRVIDDAAKASRIVRLRGEASAEELIAHCRELIATYKCPRSVEIRSEALPLSGAGKILKTELRKPYWPKGARRIN